MVTKNFLSRKDVEISKSEKAKVEISLPGMRDTTYNKFVTRWEKVIDLPVQTLGPLTPLYKTCVRLLKVMPWPYFVLLSVLVVIGLYVVVGSAITILVTILQRGF